MGINQTLSDKLENANYYGRHNIPKTLFKLPKYISYEEILPQYNLGTLKDQL